MIEKFEKYIKELPEELQEKARQCKTKEELDEFIAENGIELSDEALEMVSGGCGVSEACSTEKHAKAYCVGHRTGHEGSHYFDWYWRYCSDCKRDYYFFKDNWGNGPAEITKEEYDSAWDPIHQCHQPRF